MKIPVVLTTFFEVRGIVQGVGFRPFVYRLASELKVSGWVLNGGSGVQIEATAPPSVLNIFERALSEQAPLAARVESVRRVSETVAQAPHSTGFRILESTACANLSTRLSPDLALCADCNNEIHSPTNRRYRYPFTNCTNCGPRFSIIEALPYDRANTSMKIFAMCTACQMEYDDPSDRRFHAQPNACPECGPHVELWNSNGIVLSSHDEALRAAAQQIRDGAIIAVKGLGGFHLMADARNQDAILRLRAKKHREEKPLAVMAPTLDFIQRDCQIDALEARLLSSMQSPIVLLRKSAQYSLADAVAPKNPYLGAMLPYTPLHVLLLEELGFSLVATSGNLSDEPICIDEHEALTRLRNIADGFLVHNRPIVRHVDDSIVRVIMDREMVLRCARGYAPLPISIPLSLTENHTRIPALAVGAHLKNTVAISSGREIFVSQHIGDLETPESLAAFENVIQDFQKLYKIKPDRVLCDAHPDYASTQYAQGLQIPVERIQHHYAHVLACMADNNIVGPVLGISWDGTGYGSDQTIWGGEFLKINKDSSAPFERVAHLRSFPLPGGEKSVREPRRTALGLLYEMWGEKVFNRRDLFPIQAFDSRSLELIRQTLEKKINTPLTSSVGRLFDAVASIANICQVMAFEGQAAMELEFALPVSQSVSDKSLYEFRVIDATKPLIIDWQPLIEELIFDVSRGVSQTEISVKFHNALAEIVVSVAKRVNESKVVLSGGCFQNKYLAERTIKRLRTEGFQPFWHWRLPPNDGAISVGQILAGEKLSAQRKLR